MSKPRPLIRYLLIVAGTISVGLGLIGAFLPVLPTTPFLLLAAACYIRSSPRLYQWLIHHRIFGAYIYNYITYKAIRRSTRNGTLVFLWITLTLSFLVVNQVHVRILLVLIGVGVTVHLFMLNILSDEEFSATRIETDQKETNKK